MPTPYNVRAGAGGPFVDIEGVTGSIPVASTIPFPQQFKRLRRILERRWNEAPPEIPPETCAIGLRCDGARPSFQPAKALGLQEPGRGRDGGQGDALADQQLGRRRAVIAAGDGIGRLHPLDVGPRERRSHLRNIIDRE